MAEPPSVQANDYQDIKDVKPIINDIELEDFPDTLDPATGKHVFRQADDDGDTSTIGDSSIFQEGRKPSTSKIRLLIIIGVVVLIVVVGICLGVILNRPPAPTAVDVTDRPATDRLTAPAITSPPASTPPPNIVVGEISISLMATLAGLDYIPAYDDPTSQEYMDFVDKATTEVRRGLEDNEFSNEINNVTIVSLSPGSIVIEVNVEVNGAAADSVVAMNQSAVGGADLQLMVANAISQTINDAVEEALSNNGILQTTNVTVETNEVMVPISVGGVDLPPEITPGEPCLEGEFRCNDGTCISDGYRCNFFDNCATGEDELNCGACESYEWQCDNTKCIPDYWRCDFYLDCQDWEDEKNCAENQDVEYILLEDNVPITITNPKYPIYSPQENDIWSIVTVNPNQVVHVGFVDFEVSLHSYLVFGTGSDLGSLETETAIFYHHFEPRAFVVASNETWMMFYGGPHGGERGFELQLTAIDPTDFTPGTCAPGEFQCATDQECIPSFWQCDAYRDCAGGEDEENCKDLPPAGACTNASHEFQCYDGSCIHGAFRCDYFQDCENGEDELGCTCDEPDEFQCADGDRCIPDYYVCNWYYDCSDRSDETNCATPETTEATTLMPGQSVDFSSPNYPQKYGVNTYYAFTFQTNVGYIIQISITDFETERLSFMTFGDGLDTTSYDSFITAYTHDAIDQLVFPLEVESESNTMWIEIHGGQYGFGRFLATATAVELDCGEDEFQCPSYCIPDNFQCNYWHDCINGEDELLNCGHQERTKNYTLSIGDVIAFTSPNYPEYYMGDNESYLWSFDASKLPGDYVVKFSFQPYDISSSSYVAFGNGLDISNHSSAIGVYEGQRVDLETFHSAESKVWVRFYAGTDAMLYQGFSATAEAVLREDATVQCAPDEWACADGQTCIPSSYRCDEYNDCPSQEDEIGCVECGADEFSCPDMCIPEAYHCDAYHDCMNAEDELGCGWSDVSIDFTVEAGLPVDFTSPGYPSPYPGDNRYYDYNFTLADESYHLLFNFSFFGFGPNAYLLFGTGADFTNQTARFDIYHGQVPPTLVYTPSNVIYVTFFSGYTGDENDGFAATVSAYPKGAIPPPVVCGSNEWACLDGVTCIHSSYRCDGYHDCPANGEDEHGCPAPACREYEFECKNGECLPAHHQCNGFPQCSEGEDEVGCGFYGTCTDHQFQCADGACIPENKRCNYFYDCPDGSDETQAECGTCNALNEFECDFGNCIPDYWVCDFYYDCSNGEDEMACESRQDPVMISLEMNQRVNITSQNWPDSADHNIYQLWYVSAPEGSVVHFDFLDYDLGLQSFLTFGDGHDVSNHSLLFAYYFYRFNPQILLSHGNLVSVEYFSGAYVGTRGLFLSMVAVHHGHHHHPSCNDDAYQCAEDGECIPAYWQCDFYPDCITGDDEFNCTYPPPGECGAYTNEYKCNGTEICIHADYRCDYRSDCPNHDDEFNCQCKEGEFSCPGTGQCLPAHYVCDFYYDCIGGTEDETIGCGTPDAETKVVLDTSQPLVLTSPNYPEDYDPRAFTIHYVTVADGYIARIAFDQFDIDWKGFLAFGSGADFNDHDQVFAVYDHHDDPEAFYTPTNVFYVQFHGGPYGQSSGFQITLNAVEKSTAPTQPPPGTCQPGEFACHDGLCIPGTWECDGFADCVGDEDEAKCYASGGTCRSHQFTCNDGQCIHGSWQCDGILDCYTGEDEVDCPFMCYDNDVFTCNDSMQCIPDAWECDYQPDCTYGEDESRCGECEEDFFGCGDGACVPDYYRCDAIVDCLTGADEMDCGHVNNTEIITLTADDQARIQSPDYPMSHDSHCYVVWLVTVPDDLFIHIVFFDFSVGIHSYLSVGQGSDPDNSTSFYAIFYHRTAPREVVVPSNMGWIEYYCGVYANGRGFDLAVLTTDIATHVYPDCVEGEVQCEDGHCIPTHFLCDSFKDCAGGEDEGHGGLANCTGFDHGACGTHETEFQCSDGSCIHADYLCDQVYDCLGGEDELNCSRPCTEHEFECPGRQCIPLARRCDFYLNCLNGNDDELDCGTPETTDYIYLYQNSTNLTSPNYPGDYPKNIYTLTYVSTEPDYAIRVTFYELELSVYSFLAFADGHNVSDFSSFFDAYTHRTTYPSELYSAGNKMFIEFLTGIYGGSKGYVIGLDTVYSPTVTFAPCDDDQFQCTDDGSCIPDYYECDDYVDCGDQSDEINCVIPLSCEADEYTCNDGKCIPGTWECDIYRDCTGGEDEEGCGFTCYFGYFACEISEQCVPSSWQCDYVSDCTYNEDETSCGPCAEGYFNCTDGSCVPDYFVCDGYSDCSTEADEMNCGDVNSTEYITLAEGEERIIQSPGYPVPADHDSLCFLQWFVTVPDSLYVHVIFNEFAVTLHTYLSMGTGMNPDDETSRYAVYHHRTNPREAVIPGSVAWIMYHCGIYGMARGMELTLTTTNISTHEFDDCVAGEYQCLDGHCIPSHFLCDTIKDCSKGEDEEQPYNNCTTHDPSKCGTFETDFACPYFGSCIHQDYVCDFVIDCPFGSDELDCGPCAENEFQCPSNQCIPSNERCNYIVDCLTGDDDERNCGTIDNSEYIYVYNNATNISSVNYPNNYPKNEYTVTYIRTEPGNFIRVTFLDLDLSLTTYLAFGIGTDTQDFSKVFETYSHNTAYPAELLTISHELYIEFHTGVYSGSRGYLLQIESVSDRGVTFQPCDDDEFQCVTDGACISATWECDNDKDCGDQSDELYCDAVGGTCQPHQFTCANGDCIHADYECDNYYDCEDYSDEHEICPFECFSFYFTCNVSRQCVFHSQTCDYVADCDQGEDEAYCGPCSEGYFTCSNGGCVPPYWQCDGINHCFDAGDEKDCGQLGEIVTHNLAEGQFALITSPEFPDRYPTQCYTAWIITVPQDRVVLFKFLDFKISVRTYLTIGSGNDYNNQSSLLADYTVSYRPRELLVRDNKAWMEFHCGPFGGMGFAVNISGVELSTHVHEDCVAGEFQCSDKSCIPTFDLCDGAKNCPLGEDENQTCSTFNQYVCGTHEDEYVCPDRFYCIHGNYRCDGKFDCFFGGDELGCECSLGEFVCPGSQCIPGAYRCDNYNDCLNGNDDELNCGTFNNTQDVFITSPSMVVNISSPNYPGSYASNDYTLTSITAYSNARIKARIIDLDITIGAFLVFVDGLDTSDSSAVIQTISYGTDVDLGVMFVESMENAMSIEFHSGFYDHGRGFLIELTATGDAFMCQSNEFQCNDDSCIPLSYECDGYWGCQTGEDEHSCQAVDGTCASHLFTCNDGECIPEGYRCDFWPDCSGWEDEDGC